MTTITLTAKQAELVRCVLEHHSWKTECLLERNPRARTNRASPQMVRLWTEEMEQIARILALLPETVE